MEKDATNTPDRHTKPEEILTEVSDELKLVRNFKRLTFFFLEIS